MKLHLPLGLLAALLCSTAYGAISYTYNGSKTVDSSDFGAGIYNGEIVTTITKTTASSKYDFDGSDKNASYGNGLYGPIAPGLKNGTQDINAATSTHIIVGNGKDATNILAVTGGGSVGYAVTGDKTITVKNAANVTSRLVGGYYDVVTDTDAGKCEKLTIPGEKGLYYTYNNRIAPKAQKDSDGNYPSITINLEAGAQAKDIYGGSFISDAAVNEYDRLYTRYNKNKKEADKYFTDPAHNPFALNEQVKININNATVTGTIVGGGHGGSVNNKVTITLDGATVKGTIYGGAEGIRSYGGKSHEVPSFVDSTHLIIKDGSYEKRIFGGGAEFSTVNGDTHIEITGGTFLLAIFGGADSDGQSDVLVKGNTLVEISGGEFKGAIYGGGMSNYNADNSSLVDGNTSIKISGGKFSSSVFGGACNHATNSSAVAFIRGNSSVEITGGSLSYVFGGGLYSEVKQNSSVLLSGNATANYVIGGGSQGVVGGESKVIIKENASITGNVWGGGYGTATAAASSKSTVIELAGGEVKGNVLAGGRRQADAKASSTVTNGTKVVLKGEGTKVGGYISGLGDAGSVTKGNRVLAFDTYTGNASDDGYATVQWTKESNGSTIQQYQNFTHLEVVNSKIDLGAISSSSAGNNTFKTLQMVQSDVKAADLGGINAIQLTGEKGSSLTIDSLGVEVGSTFNISSTTDGELALVLSGDEGAEGESSLTVEGTLNISGANLLLQGNEALVDVSGVVSLTSSATLEAAGSVNVNAGTFNIGRDSVAEFAELNIEGYTSVNFAGTGAGADGVVAAGTLKVNAGATLDFNTAEGNDGAVSLSQGMVVDGGTIDMQGVAGFSFGADSTESAQNGTFVVQNGGNVITATNVQIGGADILVTGTGSKLTVGSTAASSITQIAQGSKVQGADMGEEPGATESPENTIESNIAVTDGGAVEFLSPTTYVGSADGSGTKMNVEIGENASLTFKDLAVYADMDIDFLNGADAVFKAETLSLFNESMLSIDGVGNVQLEDILLSTNSTLLSSGQVSITDELNIQGATLAFIAGTMGDAESAVDVALSLGAGAQITSLENINLSIAFESAATEGLLTNPEGNADFNILIMDGLNKLSAGDALVQNWQENFNVENLTLSTFGEQGELVELFVEKAELVYDADSGTLSLNGTIAVDNVPEPTTAALSLLSLAALAARRRRK